MNYPLDKTLLTFETKHRNSCGATNRDLTLLPKESNSEISRLYVYGSFHDDDNKFFMSLIMDLTSTESLNRLYDTLNIRFGNLEVSKRIQTSSKMENLDISVTTDDFKSYLDLVNFIRSGNDCDKVATKEMDEFILYFKQIYDEM